jgi:hypothetical protein
MTMPPAGKLTTVGTPATGIRKTAIGFFVLIQEAVPASTQDTLMYFFMGVQYLERSSLGEGGIRGR